MSQNTITSKTIGASTKRVLLKRFGDGSIGFTPQLVINGGTTDESAVVTMASTSGVVAGQPISGTGIPAGARVLSFVANTSVTMTVAATATATVSVTIDQSNRASGRRSGFAGPFLSDLFAALNAVN